MELVPFWVQIRGVPLGLSSLENVKHLMQTNGEVMELEDLAKARGFLRARLLVNTAHPLIKGCWLRRTSNRNTWAEFHYKRLQDFCYRCGRVDHVNTECTFEKTSGGDVGYGEWTKAPPVRDEIVIPRPSALEVGERRTAGTVRGGGPTTERLCQPREGPIVTDGSWEVSYPQSGATRKWRMKERMQAGCSSTSSRGSTQMALNTLGGSSLPLDDQAIS